MSDGASDNYPDPACNICGKPPGATFYVKQTDICPHCDSRERHRCVQDAMLHRGLAAALDLPGKTVLACHLIAVEQKIFGKSARFINFDARPIKGLDLQMDIQEMSQIGTSSMDGLIAIHVLNHVRDDRRALDEIARVLRPGGFFLSTVGYDFRTPTRDVANQSGDYGADALEKHAVGTFRTYHPDEYEGMVGAWFPTTRFEGHDVLNAKTHRIFLSRKA